MTEALSLFGGMALDTPSTEGIKYAGSKLKLIGHILRLAGMVDARTVLDGFSGTSRVSQAFAKRGYRVLSNDIAVWSEVFARAYLLNQKSAASYVELIAHLNALPPVDGWFTKHYGGRANGGMAAQADGLKKPWQIHNTQKLDAIRAEIDRLDLDPIDQAVALCSLMLALDQVDNTLGHFASYLQDWSARSYQKLVLKIPKVFITQEEHQVFRQDIFDLVPKVVTDLAYFDPPYGSNNDKMPPSRVRYASYYHLWTTICLNDRPALFGKSARRQDTSDTIAGSVFEDYRKGPDGRFVVVAAIERLLQMANARWIILSYSSGGRATAEELCAVINAGGKILHMLELDYKKNVMAGMRWTHEWVKELEQPNREFLFLIEKK